MTVDAHRFPRTLLLVNSPPGSAGVGELFLRDLAQHCPPGKLFRYSTVQGAGRDWPERWCGAPSAVSQVPHSRIPILTSRHLHKFLATGRDAMAREVSAFALRHEAEVLWLVLSSGFTIALSERLVGLLGLPYVVTVMDMPEYMAANQGWSGTTRASIMRAFDTVVGGARAVGAASASMARLLSERYGQDPIVQIHAVHPSLCRPAGPVPAGRSEFVVAFAGSLYAKREWNALLSGIDLLGGRLHGKRILVRFIGRFPRLGARRASFVTDMGVRSLQETLSMLSTADVAYLPYWFDERYALVTRTSFPNKLSAYLAAGLPTLFHGPAEASPVEFFRRFPVGPLCHSLAPGRIAAALESVEDPGTREQITRARHDAVREELNLDVFVGRFGRLLGVERDALLPLRPPDNDDY